MLPTSPSCSAAPLPRLPRSPRCFSRFAATCRRFRAFCTLSPGLRDPPALQRLRPTPMMTGTLSSTHTASPRLPMSLQPSSPSRPTPLELVGVLATSAAVACAKPPSAPWGVRSKRPRCVSHATRPALVASLAVVLVLDTSTLLRIMGKSWRIWSFLALLVLDVARGSFAHFRGSCGCFAGRGAGRGEDALGSHVLEFENSFVAAAEADSLETLRMRRRPNKSYYDPRKWLREAEFTMVERAQRSCVDHSNVN